MRSSSLCNIYTGNVAGDWQITGDDVLDSNDCSTQAPSHPNQYQHPAVYPLPDWQLPERNCLFVNTSFLDITYLSHHSGRYEGQREVHLLSYHCNSKYIDDKQWKIKWWFDFQFCFWSTFQWLLPATSPWVTWCLITLSCPCLEDGRGSWWRSCSWFTSSPHSPSSWIPHLRSWSTLWRYQQVLFNNTENRFSSFPSICRFQLEKMCF